MKKRLISFLLALSMMLSLVPVGVVAHAATNANPTHITLKYDSYGRPAVNGPGWKYGNNILTIQKGYYFDQSSLGSIPSNSSGILINGLITYHIINYGVISGGKFGANRGIGGVENHGIIKDGTNGSPTFYFSLYNGDDGTIEGGSTSASAKFYNAGTVTGGTFESYVGNESGTIEGGTFTGIVRNEGKLTGGTYDTIYSDTAISAAVPFNLLITSQQPASGSYYTIQHDTAGETFYLHVINNVGISGTDISDPIYLQASDSTTTITLQTTAQINSINGFRFTGCTADTSSSNTYISTIDLSRYAAGSTLVLSTVTVPVHTPTADDFVYNAPLHFVVDDLDDLEKSLKESISIKNGISKDDVTILYVDKDDTVLNSAPTEEGDYSFKISVKEAADGSYSATDEPLTAPGWTFTIHPTPYSVRVTGGYAYYRDTDGTERPISSEVGIYPGTKVYLKVADPDAAFYGWQLDEGSAKPDAATSNLTLKEGSYFIMPSGNVKLSLAPAGSDSGNTGDNTGGSTSAAVSSGDAAAGAGAALVVGGAALGGAAYLVGTQLWLEANLPADASIPTRRQQLADLLWKQAGMPEPASTVLYPDVTAADSQKAARWCVEQGLLKDLGETFQPAKHVFRPQVIKAWKQLQAGQKAG